MMSVSIEFAMITFVFACAIIYGLGYYARPRAEKDRQSFPFAIFIAFGVCVLFASAIMGNVTMSGNKANDIHATARIQDIEVAISPWEQLVTTLNPCEIKLEFRDDEEDGNHSLVIKDTEAIATPQLLESLCP